jgi:hypothetical protein
MGAGKSLCINNLAAIHDDFVELWALHFAGDLAECMGRYRRIQVGTDRVCTEAGSWIHRQSPAFVLTCSDAES